MKKVLIINGSLGGATGNTSRYLERLAIALGGRQAKVETVHLAAQKADIESSIHEADAFVFATGTYWDSWGSPLQKFLEDSTHLEGNEAWFGKPAACLITMHSVGGKSVLSRLQGVLSTLGLLIPPQSGIVLSAVGQSALLNEHDGIADDIWHPDDIETIADNLLIACSLEMKWRIWPVDKKDPRRIWFMG